MSNHPRGQADETFVRNNPTVTGLPQTAESQLQMGTLPLMLNQMTRPFRNVAPPSVEPSSGRRPRAVRPVFVAAGSAVAGFITGALFWHMIGFWSFVSHVVLKGPDDDAVAAIARVQDARAAVQAPIPVAMRPTGSISPVRATATGRAAVVPKHCSVAVADDTVGEVVLQPCSPGTVSAPSKPLALKADRMTSVAGPSEARPRPAFVPSQSERAEATKPAWAPTIKGPLN